MPFKFYFYINTFNLFLDVDPLNKIVYINKFEDYFYNTDYTYNLDEKSTINIAKIQTKKDYKRTYYNTNVDSDDALISDKETNSPAVERTDTVNYYEKDVVFNTKYKDVNEITGFYSDTKSALFSFIQNGNFVTGFILPAMSSEDSLTYKLGELNDGSQVNTLNYQTRILNYHGLFRVRPADPLFTNTTGSQLWIEDVAFYYDTVASIFTFSQVPQPGTDFIIPVALYYSNNGYYDIPPSSDYSLNYSNEYLNNQKYFGIFDRYFKNFVISLSNTLLVEVEVYLNTQDINEMNPRRLISFNNQTYYLNTIKEYDPLIEQTTTVSLIKKPN